MSTYEKNQLIAEFLGWKLRELPVSFAGGVSWFSYCGKTGTHASVQGEELFHESWDWLMPVVKKCLTVGDNPNEWDAVLNALQTVDIKTTHEAVVEFIQYYNEHK